MTKLQVLLMLVLISNTRLSSTNFDSVEINLLKIRIEKGISFYVLALSSENKKYLDSMVKLEENSLRYYGENLVSLSCSGIKNSPWSFIFEDDLNGMIPYYKIVVGFENKVRCVDRFLEFNIFSRNYKIKIPS